MTLSYEKIGCNSLFNKLLGRQILSVHLRTNLVSTLLNTLRSQNVTLVFIDKPLRFSYNESNYDNLKITYSN